MTDVPERVRDSILRNAASAAIADLPHAREFQQVYVPSDRVEELDPAQQDELAQLQALLSLLRSRAQERAQMGR